MIPAIISRQKYLEIHFYKQIRYAKPQKISSTVSLLTDTYFHKTAFIRHFKIYNDINKNLELNITSNIFGDAESPTNPFDK